jgi:hypothetical protein
MGYMSREIDFLGESYGVGDIDFSHTISLKELSDFESVEDHVNSTSILPVLSGFRRNKFPNSGKLLGHARTCQVNFQDSRRSVFYLWANIYFKQDIFESISNSLGVTDRYEIELDGFKYMTEDIQDGPEMSHEEKFVITNASFKTVIDS